MQLLRYADLHCDPLRYPNASRRESRLAICYGVLGSVVRGQRPHQAPRHSRLSHVHSIPTYSIWLSHIGARLLCWAAGWSSDVLQRWNVHVV